MSTKDILCLIALMVTAFGIGIDFTGALLLVTAIGESFGADITATQWVLNIYALFFAMMMVAGGRLGDMYGHRPIIMIGLIIFFVASIFCYLAPDLGVLVAARAFQGVGAGFVWPCVMGFAATRIGKEEHTGFVIGMLMAGITTGNVFGPLISGFVVYIGEWRFFFLANVFFSTVSLVTLRLLLPKDAPREPDERIDFAGMAILSLAILMLLYALDVGADLGWTSALIIALFVCSAALFGLFPWLERRVGQPLIPPVMMKNRPFVILLSLNALQVPAIFLGLLYFPQYMQKVLGWSSLTAALGLIPMTLLLAVGSVLSGTLYNDFGPKKLLTAGYLLCTIGAALIFFTPASLGYFHILPGMLCLGLGATLSVGPAGTVAMQAVAPERAGLVGGLTFMVHLVYGAVAVAVGTAAMYVTSLARLGENLTQSEITVSAADQKTLNGASIESSAVKNILSGFDGDQVTKIKSALNSAFESGMDVAFLIAFLSALIGLILIIILMDEGALKKKIE